LDTGVDYTNPYLGNASCNISYELIGNMKPELVESRHNYRRNTDETYTITKPGFENIAVHFERLETEQGYDFVYILDAYDNIVEQFSGTYADVWSISVPGDTIKINLVSDSLINDWGFRVDQVLNGTAKLLWQNCGNIVGGYDFENGDFFPFDDNGHGTHVAGIVASRHPTYRGVAYGANIIANKVLDASGSGFFSSSAAAIDWCIAHKDEYNIKIISMSLGDGGQYNSPANCPTIPPAALIAQAKAAGIATIVASGNNGYSNGISFPACVSDAISVGAVYDANVGSVAWSTCTDSSTYADKITCFTNTDELLDVMAPGALVTSTVPTGTCELCDPSGFNTLGGTSMATPMVSGLAALHFQKNTTLTPHELLIKLKQTDTYVTDLDNGLSFPRVDAMNLLDDAFLLNLKQGWNLISIPLVPQNKTEIFQDMQVYGYNGGWFEPDLITPENGYWIKSDTNKIVPIQAEQASVNTSLNPGWNLVGYPYLKEYNISGNMAVFSYNGTWSTYIPNKTQNSLQTLKPGFGYFVKN
jgi:subtilisin family serine protease